MNKKKRTHPHHQVHHVVPKPSGGWAIKRDGATKAIKVFSTKGDAVEFAREISRKQGAEIVIHGRDGRIMSTQAYGETGQSEARPESGFGCARGLIITPPNFDEPLEEFNEYI
jgi:hypothetical protein